MIEIDLHGCAFTGGIPASYAQLPVATTVLKLYDNLLTEDVSLALQRHARWADWNPETNILPQRNGVILRLEGQTPDPPVKTDRDYLIEIYHALGGGQMSKKAHWNTEAPIAKWEGVKLNAEGRVHKLDLSTCGASGAFPLAICKLTALDTLLMGGNPGITGAFPEALGNLVNMKNFNAVGCRGITGTLPEGMGRWSRLENLQISGCLYGGTIPAAWAGMTSLRNLGMYDTNLEGPFPEEIFDAWKHIASILWHKNKKLTGPLPAGLGRMKTDAPRFNIHLHECNFTGGIPRSWGNIPAVSSQLFINDNALTEKVPKELQQHPSWVNNIWPKDRILKQQNGITLELE